MLRCAGFFFFFAELQSYAYEGLLYIAAVVIESVSKFKSKTTTVCISLCANAL